MDETAAVRGQRKTARRRGYVMYLRWGMEWGRHTGEVEEIKCMGE